MKAAAGFVKYLKSALRIIVGVSIPAARVKIPQDANLEEYCKDELRRVIEECLNDRLFMQELFNSMDADTKRISEWHTLGYTIDQIAKELDIPSDSLAERYMNGVGRAALKVLHTKQDQRQ